MNTAELYSGKQSYSKVMRKHGHITHCIDNDPQFNNDMTEDMMNVTTLNYRGSIDRLWASVPCTGFSVAVIGRNWNKDGTPKSDSGRLGLKLLRHTIYLISNTMKDNPELIWYIENPRGMMRKVIEPIFKEYGLKFVRHTVTYCQYGDTRMKPTDIFTNDMKWNPKPPCKNGMPCHEAAPRGSRTGTQGLKNAALRSVIPAEIFEEILLHNKLNKKLDNNGLNKWIK